MKSLPSIVLATSMVALALACQLDPAASSEPAARDAHVAASEVEEAVVRSLPLMQSSMETWVAEAGCMSCHHQGLGAMAVALAAERGFEIEEDRLDEQLQHMASASAEIYAGLLQGDAGINPTFGHSYMLLGLAAAGHPRDDVSDVRAYYLAGNVSESGAWYSESHRPPLEDSPVTATAIAARALALFHPDGRSSEIDRKVRRGREWLEAHVPRSNEERVMRLLGLGWTGGTADAIRAASADLARQQRADGGWAQIATLESDAYATGQALVALQQMGGLSADSDTYRRGVRFLLETQEEDGSWLVETRRRSRGLEYLESGFPHRMHQFISFAGTAWATMALCLTIDPGPSRVFLGPRPERASRDAVSPDTGARDAGMKPVHLAAAFGTLEELEHALADDADAVHARGPDGLTPLMLAVHDERKIELLLERGAEVEATSGRGSTPLSLAAWQSGSPVAVEALLAFGAPVGRTADSSRAVVSAAKTGGTTAVAQLLDRGADIEAASPDGLTLLHWAEASGNLELLDLLLERGANTEAVWEMIGATPLVLAAFDGWPDLLQHLIDAGADVNATDGEGMTALAWAAKIDHGHADILHVLLRAGADPTLTAENGRTPLDWAEYFGNELAVATLSGVGTVPRREPPASLPRAE